MFHQKVGNTPVYTVAQHKILQYELNKQTPWLLVRRRIIPTKRRPLDDEILVATFVDRRVSRGQRGGSPTVVNLNFLERSRYFSLK
jgi:hypothetical protein